MRFIIKSIYNNHDNNIFIINAERLRIIKEKCVYLHLMIDSLTIKPEEFDQSLEIDIGYIHPQIFIDLFDCIVTKKYEIAMGDIIYKFMRLKLANQLSFVDDVMDRYVCMSNFPNQYLSYTEIVEKEFKLKNWDTNANKFIYECLAHCSDKEMLENIFTIKNINTFKTLYNETYVSLYKNNPYINDENDKYVDYEIKAFNDVLNLSSTNYIRYSEGKKLLTFGDVVPVITENIFLNIAADYNLGFRYGSCILNKIEYQTKEMCMKMLKINGLFLSEVREQTYDLCMQAVEENGLALEDVDDIYKTAELCKKAVDQNGCAIEYVNDLNKTEELCNKAKLTRKQHWQN